MPCFGGCNAKCSHDLLGIDMSSGKGVVLIVPAQEDNVTAASKLCESLKISSTVGSQAWLNIRRRRQADLARCSNSQREILEWGMERSQKILTHGV